MAIPESKQFCEIFDFYRISPALGHGGPANQTDQQNKLFLLPLLAALQLPPKAHDTEVIAVPQFTLPTRDPTVDI